MTRYRAQEADVQRAVVAALRMALPGAVIHHSPNEHRAGGPSARRVQGIRAGMGLSPGWPDLVVLAQGRVLFLEIKGPRGRLAPAQVAFRDRVRAEGHHWSLVRSVDDALDAAAAAGLVVRARVGGGRS